MNSNPNDNLSPEKSEPTVVTEVNTEIVEQPSDTIDVGNIISNYLHHWYWFVISMVVCVGFGVFYMHKKSPQYLIKSIIMLNQNEEESGSLSSLSAIASQFGFGGGSSGSSSNIYDEMTRLRSEQLLSEAVGVCHLNEISWENQGFFKPKAWYYGDSPFAIRVPQEVLDSISVVTVFELDYKPGEPTKIKVKQKGDKVLDTEIKTFPYTVRTPAATFVIDKTKYFKPSEELEFHSMISGTSLTVYDLRSCLSIDEVDKKGNAIYQDITSADVRRGEATLNTITSLYNQGRYDQKLKRRKEALAFVEERLLNLYRELEESENKIEQYKRDNKIVDPTAEAEYIFARKGAIETASTQTRTELEIFRMLRDMLSSPDKRYSLLPYASAPGQGADNGLTSAVGAYNDLILKRMELTSGLKGQSAQLERINEQLTALRENILTTLTREIQAKKIELSTVEGENGISNSRMTEIPSIEKHLTQLYRDREVKNAIYAFLLQKREEAEIAVQQVEPIIEVIDPAYADPEPVSPKPMLVYGVAVFMGIVLPLVFVKLLCRPRKKENA